MARKKDPNRILRGKLNLTIHPEIRTYADELALKKRRSVSQLFEDLIEAEWVRMTAPAQPAAVSAVPVAPVQQPAMQQQPLPPPYYVHPYAAPFAGYAPVAAPQQQQAHQ